MMKNKNQVEKNRSEVARLRGEIKKIQDAKSSFNDYNGSKTTLLKTAELFN